MLISLEHLPYAWVMFDQQNICRGWLHSGKDFLAVAVKYASYHLLKRTEGSHDALQQDYSDKFQSELCTGSWCSMLVCLSGLVSVILHFFPVSGRHTMSGACIEPTALEELFPDWKERGVSAQSFWELSQPQTPPRDERLMKMAGHLTI